MLHPFCALCKMILFILFPVFHHYCTSTSSTEATAASCPSEGQLSYGHTSRPGPGASSLYVELAGDESLTCSAAPASTQTFSFISCPCSGTGRPGWKTKSVFLIVVTRDSSRQDNKGCVPRRWPGEAPAPLWPPLREKQQKMDIYTWKGAFRTTPGVFEHLKSRFSVSFQAQERLFLNW